MATKDPIYQNGTQPSKTGRWGEIDKFIPQTSPSYMDASDTEKTVTLVLKGPTCKLEDLQGFCENMLKADEQSSKTLQYFMGNSSSIIQWAVGAYTGGTPMYTVMFPQDAAGAHLYVLDSYNIEECNPAGLMCIFRIKFKWELEQDTSQPESKPDYTYWTCNMAQTQIDVLAYCTNVSKKDGDDETGSFATNIQTWMNQTEDTAVLKPDWKYQSVLGAKEIKTLNSAEIAIAQKLIAGKSPLRHYPVVVKNEVYSAKPTVKFDNIDHIGNPDGCPFTLTGWTWLCTGINVNYNSTTNITQVSTEWTGSEEWDKEFYGGAGERWEFGKVDTTVVKGGGGQGGQGGGESGGDNSQH